jgi:P27 family predicted phage terminase small subunit
MARPCKSAKVLTPHSQSVGETKFRIEKEDELRGTDDNLLAPKYLSASQKKIYKYIVDHLKESRILGNVDTYILESASIAIDRIREIEKRINKDPDLLMNRELMAAKTKYSSEFIRYCTELSLSPQSRAKIGNLNLQAVQNESDPLLKLLDGGKKKRFSDDSL